MRRIVRENAGCAFLAACGCAAMAWLGLYGFGWNDYEAEARPAFEALTHGHVLEFLRLAPAYGGSLVERAPFALLPSLWGGGPLAVYRAVAVPCLMATALLGAWLVMRMRRAGAPRLPRMLALGVCVANPITLRALELGHPEELMGACLCVAAVLLASGSSDGRDHSLLAGVLLGLAIANKEWALLAVGPVVLALAPARRMRCMAAAGATAAAVLAPLILATSGGFVASTRAAAAPAAIVIFKPWQLLWFFGHHSALALGPGARPDSSYRVAPTWAGEVSHPLVLLAGAVLAAALLPRARKIPLPRQTALLALSLVLLLRCLLDTWNESYYLLPFVLALLTWEVCRAPRRAPVLALACTALVWLSFQWLPEYASADAQSAFFLVWSLPLVAWLGMRLFLAVRRAPIGAPPQEATPAHETTVSSLGRLVSTS